MALIIDTSILILAERQAKGSIDFKQWEAHGDAFISAITVSELLVGVHLADTEKRRLRRSAFVEAILARVPALDFTPETARVHSEVYATLSKSGKIIGSHDLLIAATALAHGYAVLTENAEEFRRVPGLKVLTP